MNARTRYEAMAKQAAGEKVDVLAWFDDLIRNGEQHHEAEARIVRAAVAKLIEASNALLAGSIAQAVAADHPDMSQADKDDASWRASNARDSMRAALDGGAA